MKKVLVYLVLLLSTNKIFLDSSHRKYKVVSDPKSTQEFNDIINNSDLTIVFGKNSKEDLNRNMQKSAFSFYSKNKDLNVSLIFFNDPKNTVAKSVGIEENKIAFYKSETSISKDNKKHELKPKKLNDQVLQESDLINPTKCISKIAQLASKYFIAASINNKVGKTALEKVKHSKSVAKKTGNR